MHGESSSCESPDLALLDAYDSHELWLIEQRADLVERLEQIDGALGDEFSRAWSPDAEVTVGRSPSTGGSLSPCRDGEPADGAGPGGGNTPPCVIRGAKSQGVGIDWLRFSGPDDKRYVIEQYLSSYFPEDEPEKVSGLWGYCRGLQYGGGVRLVFNDPKAGDVDRQKGHFGVEIPGGVLSRMWADRRLELLTHLVGEGLTCTRIDVALDVVADHVELCQAVEAACERGELCGARSFNPVKPRRVDGSVKGYTVYLGERGKKGSGRMVRCYDKGLEQGGFAPDTWHRWEAEFSGDCADMVARCLISESGTDWSVIARAVALGAVDFLEVTGRRELSRRPRASWWAEVRAFLGREVEPVRIKAKRRMPSYDRWRMWIQGNVLPTVVAMAAEAECSLEELTAELLKGTKRPSAATTKGAVLRDYRALLDRRAEAA